MKPSTPIGTTVVLCLLVVVVHLRFNTLQPVNNSSVTTIPHNAVLQTLQAAFSNNQTDRFEGGARNPTSGCCRTLDHASLNLGPVLSEVAAFVAAAAPANGGSAALLTRDDAQLRQLLFESRQRVGARWAAALQPAAAGLSQVKNNCSCRAVRITPFAFGQPTHVHADDLVGGTRGNSSGASSPPSTTLLLVVNSWEYLISRQLATSSIDLFMVWAYASMHGYDLHIYVHGAELPPWMPVYFIKPPGIAHMLRDWGYAHVAYLDWDVLISPHSAPPLSLFYGEYPAASLLQQGEYNLCAGVNLWRNTPAAAALLRAWWELGYAGCCPTTQHDQSALKHLVAAYLANFTGQADLYGHKQQAHFALPPVHPATAAAAAAAAGQPAASAQDWQRTVYSTESPPQSVSAYLRIRPQLQQRGSAIGLVGLDAHYLAGPAEQQPPRVVLTSCMGNWWGCVPAGTPALLYHVGHGAVENLDVRWLPQRMMVHLKDWATVSGLLEPRAAAAHAGAGSPSTG